MRLMLVVMIRVIMIFFAFRGHARTFIKDAEKIRPSAIIGEEQCCTVRLRQSVLCVFEFLSEREIKDNIFPSDTDTVKGETLSNISGEQSFRTQA